MAQPTEDQQQLDADVEFYNSTTFNSLTTDQQILVGQIITGYVANNEGRKPADLYAIARYARGVKVK